MNKVFNEYKKQIKYFLNNKIYMISVILVAILSYGFTITHYSIGIDDLCFDRYVSGTYILSAKRWGTWALYNIFNIKEFSPFWLDFIVALLMVVIAIVLSAFIKKQFGDKIKTGGYIIFSSLLISNPLINQFFIYQSTNLAIVVSNLIVICCSIVIFENYFNENKKYINIISGLILTIPISMYESCIQTFLVFLFVTIFIKTIQNNTSLKKLFKYFCLSVLMLALGVAMYFIIGKALLFILDKLGYMHKNFAYNHSLWTNEIFKDATIMEKIHVVYKLIVQDMVTQIKVYLPIRIFIIFFLIIFVMEYIDFLKTNKLSKLVILVGTFLTNFIFIVLLTILLFRMQFSWIVTTAFMGLYIYQKFTNKEKLKYIINMCAILLIIVQTRMLNQYFYNDYKRYEKEKYIANDIAINVMKTTDYKNKPILCITTEPKDHNIYEINGDNGLRIFQWGITAFDESQTEITKFINEQGYEFLYITDKESKKAKEKFKNLDEETKNKNIIELDDVIVINLKCYDFL